MAQDASAEGSMSEMHKKLAQIVETKQYIDEPGLIPWYRKDLTEIKPHTRHLFETYSHIAPAEVEAHIRKIRDEAFKVFPYPCVGNWGFLNLSVAESPVYKEVLQRIKDGEKYLDIGCCMGQDIRKLAHDGAPPENMYGSDLKKEFWDIGYDLFLDKQCLSTTFIEADIFDNDSDLKELDGKLGLVHTASFFHLFDWNGQVKAAKRVVELLRSEPGVMIFGRQGGMPQAGALPSLDSYWHNSESWAELWKQVGDKTGTKWEIESFLGDEDLTKRMNAKIMPAGTRFLTFNMRRL